MNSGGSDSGTTIDSGGEQYVLNGGRDSGAQISGGTQFDFGSATNAAVVASGSQIVESGGVATGTAILAGGVLEVNAGGTLAGSLLFCRQRRRSANRRRHQLEHPRGLTVSGFVAGDTIDPAGIAFDSNGSVNLQAGNVLQIIKNGATYDLQLDPSQNFVGGFFHLAT